MKANAKLSYNVVFPNTGLLNACITEIGLKIEVFETRAEKGSANSENFLEIVLYNLTVYSMHY